MDLTLSAFHSPNQAHFRDGSYSSNKNDHELSNVSWNGMHLKETSDADLKNIKNDESKPETDELVESLEWKDGVGSLPGSDLKFRVNGYGVVELITEVDDFDNKISVNLNDHSEDECNESVVEVKGESSYVNNEIQKRGKPRSVEKLMNNEVENQVVEKEMMDVSEEKEDLELERKKDRKHGEMNYSPNLTPGQDPRICPICGNREENVKFYGRFCSRKCLAKNANMHRKSYPTSNKMTNKATSKEREQYPMNVDVASVVNERGKRNSNDLKIRIRLSSSPSAEKSFDRKRQIVTKPLKTMIGGPGNRRKKKFIWQQYLDEQNAISAPEELFRQLTARNPFPDANMFSCGMALEGIDPKHQSMICPLSVTSIQGYRIRLHFCGFSESYDFWVNADCPFIFPCGFCERTGRKLEVPKGYTSHSFKWETFMKKFKLIPAPSNVFALNHDAKKCGFNPGEKLEAVDKHNPELICVATVSDVIGENILVHFDGWTHDFDYWCSSSSYLIHPVGWSEKEGRELTPPEGYTDVLFFWDKYLKETTSKAADECSFIPREKHGFEAGMKLEVVDARNPVLIRVATISEVSGFRILIHFDGWSNLYDLWTDLESTDIHPAGWCNKTNSAIQPPVSPGDLIKNSGQGGCPIPGCTGIGHVKGAKYLGHHSEFGCPYSPQNLQRDCLNDRLAKARLSTTSDITERASEEEESDIRPPKLRRKTRKSSSPNFDFSALDETQDDIDNPGKEGKTVISSSELNSLVDDNGKSQYSALHHSVFLSALSSFPNYDLPLCWNQHAKLLPNVQGMTVSEVCKWSTKDVSKFVAELTGHHDHSDVFRSEEVDGEALLLLTQADISKVLKIKLGPAVKIYNAILLIKAAEHLPV